MLIVLVLVPVLVLVDEVFLCIVFFLPLHCSCCGCCQCFLARLAVLGLSCNLCLLFREPLLLVVGVLFVPAVNAVVVAANNFVAIFVIVFDVSGFVKLVVAMLFGLAFRWRVVVGVVAPHAQAVVAAVAVADVFVARVCAGDLNIAVHCFLLYVFNVRIRLILPSLLLLYFLFCSRLCLSVALSWFFLLFLVSSLLLGLLLSMMMLLLFLLLFLFIFFCLLLVVLFLFLGFFVSVLFPHFSFCCFCVMFYCSWRCYSGSCYCP